MMSLKYLIGCFSAGVGVGIGAMYYARDYSDEDKKNKYDEKISYNDSVESIPKDSTDSRDSRDSQEPINPITSVETVDATEAIETIDSIESIGSREVPIGYIKIDIPNDKNLDHDDKYGKY